MDVKLGLITGTGITKIEGLEIIEEKVVDTPFGKPSGPIMIGNIGGKTIAHLKRHGKDIPPHMVNHRANLWAMRETGVSKIISTTSVGSLNFAIEPPCIMIPNDYVNLFSEQSIFDNQIVHVTPELCAGLRKLCIDAAVEEGVEVITEGTYVQTTGPRLETKAEIHIIKSWGEVVGMNMGTEATLAKELELGYANISSVDNYAHGIKGTSPSYPDIVASALKNWEHVKRIINGVAKKL